MTDQNTKTELDYDDWPRLYAAVETMEKLASEQSRKSDADEWTELKAKVTKMACEAFPVIESEAVSIECPVCEQITDVYHFQWEAITCQICKNMVQRSRWKLWQDSDQELPF